MQRMSTLDAGLLFVEQKNVPMHLGSLAVFEGPPPCYQELADRYAARLARVARYCQVVRAAPLQVFRPAWGGDEHFEIGYHLRHAAVPRPGGPPQLRQLAGQIFAQPLNRRRPLWEAWLLQGIAGGYWAILSKVHPCVVDGIGGTALMAEVFDQRPDAGPPVPPAGWQPQRGPSGAATVAGGVRDAVSWPLRQLAGVPGLVRGRLPGPAGLAAFGRGLTGGARRLAVPAASCLNGPAGPHRRWAWTTASRNRVKRIGHELGGTADDVLLAAITRGFRDLLAGRGELTDGLVVRSLVPISARGADEPGGTTNRVSAVLANLPVAEPDPVARLRLVRAQTGQINHTHQAAGAALLSGMLGFAPPTLLALGSRAAFRIPQPLVQTVTANVPGPRFPLSVLGRQMVQAHPYVPIGGNARIGIAILSYLGRFSFGITADTSAAPGLDALPRGIRRGLAELQAQPSAGEADRPVRRAPERGSGRRTPKTLRRRPRAAQQKPRATRETPPRGQESRRNPPA